VERKKRSKEDLAVLMTFTARIKRATKTKTQIFETERQVQR
jgi:hypothetical protein